MLLNGLSSKFYMQTMLVDFEAFSTKQFQFYLVKLEFQNPLYKEFDFCKSFKARPSH